MHLEVCGTTMDHAVTEENVMEIYSRPSDENVTDDLETVEQLVASFLWATRDMNPDDELNEEQAATVLKNHGFGEVLINGIIDKSVALREARLGLASSKPCEHGATPWRFLLAKRDQMHITLESSKPQEWSGTRGKQRTDAYARPYPTNNRAKEVTGVYPLQHQTPAPSPPPGCFLVESSSQNQGGSSASPAPPSPAPPSFAGEALDYRTKFLSILESQNNFDLAWRAAKRQQCCHSKSKSLLFKLPINLMCRTQKNSFQGGAPRSPMR
jgi:hypothetical protein